MNLLPWKLAALSALLLGCAQVPSNEQVDEDVPATLPPVPVKFITPSAETFSGTWTWRFSKVNDASESAVRQGQLLFNGSGEEDGVTSIHARVFDCTNPSDASTCVEDTNSGAAVILQWDSISFNVLEWGGGPPSKITGSFTGKDADGLVGVAGRLMTVEGRGEYVSDGQREVVTFKLEGTHGTP